MFNSLMVQLVQHLTQSFTLRPWMNPKRSAALFIGLIICSALILVMQYRLNSFIKVSALAQSPSNSAGGLPPSFPVPWGGPTGGPPPPPPIGGPPPGGPLLGGPPDG